MPVTVSYQPIRRLYTGLVPARVLAINPTKEELNDKLNIPAEKEPVYLTDGTNRAGQPIKKMRIEMYFESVKQGNIPEGIRARLALFTGYEHVANMQVNNFGRFSGKSAAEDPEFYKSAWQKPVFDGEMDLMLAMEALLNPRKGTEFYMEHKEHLFYHGYTQELQEWLTVAGKNTVQILLGVQTDSQNRNYQTCFKKPLASWITQYDKFHTQLLKRLSYKPETQDTYYGPIEATYTQASYALREWLPQGQGEAELVTDTTPASSTAPVAPPAPMGPSVGGPLAAAAAPAAMGNPRFNAKGQPVKWALTDTESGDMDPNSPDYNPQKLPF